MEPTIYRKYVNETVLPLIDLFYKNLENFSIKQHLAFEVYKTILSDKPSESLATECMLAEIAAFYYKRLYEETNTLLEEQSKELLELQSKGN